MKKLIGFAICCCIVQTIFAQDSLKVLSLRRFFRSIHQWHPIAKQAALLSAQAQAELTMARGSFDPVLQADGAGKIFKDKEYYTDGNYFVKVPLWVGDLKIGLERSVGTNTDESSATPTAGLAYSSISIPIGRGLLIDERRATLRSAQLFLQMAEAEQIKILNKLYFSAAKQYWEWYESWRKLNIYRIGLELARARLDMVKENVRLGDAAAIDTVEALIEVQKREALLLETQVDFQNNTLLLSNFLWDAEGNPVMPAPNVIPQWNELRLSISKSDTLETYKEYAERFHPELRKLRLKIKQLEIEKRLRVEMLKPQLNLEYKPLLQANQSISYVTGDYLTQNYKYGFSFYMPMFLRKERGKLQSVRFKQQQTELELLLAEREILNDIQAAYNELLKYEGLIRLQTENVRNSQILRDGEEERFESGESSLFIINARERSLIEAQVKLAEIEVKYAKALASFRYSSGLPMFDE